MKRNQPAGSQMLLMMLPIFLLAGFGFWLQKQGPSQTVPFKLVISKLEATPLPKSPFANSNLRAKGVRAIIWIGHQGPAPAWWGTDVNPSHPRVLFLQRRDKDYGGNNGHYSGTPYDAKRNEYSLIFKGEIPATPLFLESSLCEISLGLETQMQPPKPLASLQASIPKPTLTE